MQRLEEETSGVNNYIGENDVRVANQEQEVEIPVVISGAIQQESVEEHQEKGSTDDQEELMKEKLKYGFIRKVYSILLTQLLITCVFSMIAFIPRVSIFIFETKYLLIPACITLCIMMILYAVYPSVLRRVPNNYIFMGIWTMLISYLVSCSCLVAGAENSIVAGVGTILLVFCLTLYSCVSNVKYNSLGAFAISFVCMIFDTVFLLFFLSAYSILYPMLGIFIFSVYIISDVHNILEEFEVEMVDDYMAAALRLYLDIINIFLKLLELLSRYV